MKRKAQSKLKETTNGRKRPASNFGEEKKTGQVIYNNFDFNFIYLVQVQVKKTEETFCANIEKDTGRITFIPKGKKKAITFDARKHKILNDDMKPLEPHMDATKQEEKMEEKHHESHDLSSESDCEDKKSCEEEEETKPKSQSNTRKRSRRVKPVSYKEDPYSDNDDEKDISDDEDEDVKPKQQTNSRRRAQPQCYKENLSDDEIDENEDDDLNDATKSEKSTPSSAYLKSGYAMGLEVEGGDWRIQSVIDY